MTTGTAHSHFLSIPLSQMLTCPVAIGPVVPGPVTKPGGNFLSDPIVSFDGLHVGKLPAGDDCSLGGFASDDSGAVGFNHYVQVVNTAIAVYDKSGNVVAGPVSTTTFWQNQPDCGGNQIWSDWLYGSIDTPTDGSSLVRAGDETVVICVWLSLKTSDPTGPFRSVRVRGQQHHQSPCEGTSTITRRSLYFPTPTMRRLIPTRFSADWGIRFQLSSEGPCWPEIRRRSS